MKLYQIIFMSLIGLMLFACSRQNSPPHLVKESVTVITLKYENGVEEEIKDKQKIENFINEISFITKEPCKCLHTEKVIFSQNGQIIKFSICEHCMDFEDSQGKTVGYYGMPPKFYALFTAHKKQKIKD